MPKKREVKPLLLENQTHKRRDRAQELRSARRQGVLAKRRKFDAGRSAVAGVAHAQLWTEEQVTRVVRGIQGSSATDVLPHLVELRKLLSLEEPPMEEVVEREGLAPKLLELLAAPNDEIQIETTWCLTNIASSSSHHTRRILGASPQLIGFLSAPNPALQEQALWALGNIAGDSADFREMLHANGVLLPVFRLLQQPPTSEIELTAAWAISNLARGDQTPGTPFLAVAPVIIAALRGNRTTAATAAATATAAAANTIGGENKMEESKPLRVEAAWTLAFLTAKENETASELVRAGMVPALVEALVDSGGQDPLCTPALRALGNMVSGAEEWADAVMAHREFLPCLDRVLKSQIPPVLQYSAQDNKPRRGALVKEAAWVASNVAAGRKEHREALVAHGMPAVMTALLLSDQLDLQQEAAYGIWNMVSHDPELLLQAARDENVLGAFIGLLRTQSPPVVRCALSFLQIVCQNVPNGPLVVEEAGGLEAIDDVHYSGQMDPDLQEAAGSIVDRFYGEDGYDSSDEDGNAQDLPGGNWGNASLSNTVGFQQQQQQQQQQPASAPLGRGSHLTRPAWMNQNQNPS